MYPLNCFLIDICVIIYWYEHGVHVSGTNSLNGLTPIQRHYVLVVEEINTNIVSAIIIVMNIWFLIVSQIGYNSGNI